MIVEERSDAAEVSEEAEAEDAEPEREGNETAAAASNSDDQSATPGTYVLTGERPTEAVGLWLLHLHFQFAQSAKR